MFYIEAPNENYGDFPHKPSIFMAGGITGCPDWQREMRDALINVDAVFYNPRRANFPIDDPEAAEAQIAWEHKYLHQSDAIMFWFPCETMCPIVLFELGAWSHYQKPVRGNNVVIGERKPIFVGAHPDYQRRQDVVLQMKCERPEIEVVDSLFELQLQVKKWIKDLRDKR